MEKDINQEEKDRKKQAVKMVTGGTAGILIGIVLLIWIIPILRQKKTS